MFLIQLTGLSGAGKTTITALASAHLQESGLRVLVIDGDTYRQTLCKDLGFSRADRQENIRRLARFAAEQQARFDLAFIAAINPFDEIRQELVQQYAARTVWIRCALPVLMERDTKGLYRRALLPDQHPDKIYNLTGVNDPYEEPAAADLIIDTGTETAEESSRKLVEFIRQWISS